MWDSVKVAFKAHNLKMRVRFSLPQLKLLYTMNTIKLGSRGIEVKTLQGKLNLLVDGIFGLITQEAVK